MALQGMQDLLLTVEGWWKLNAELRSLQERRRSVATAAVTTDGPRGELALIDRRIAQIHDLLARALIVSATDREPGTVGVGSELVVRWDDGEEETFTLVGPPEIDPRDRRISYESVVGQALLGRREGESVDVRTPAGSQSLKILAVA